jgi:ABC-type sulfate/molybdate transport systems ATPase subunit
MLDAYIVKTRPAFVVEAHLRLRQGESLALFGASGAGKSTILSCIAGLETPDAGEIRFGDARVFPPSLALYRRPLAYLSQRDSLFPHLSVAENVRFGVRDHWRNGASAWLDELKTRLGLEPLWSQPARRLSGGQRRRVALARMLARKPPLVLLDEPFAGLDRLAVSDLVEILIGWRAALGFSLIAVDHRAEILAKLCERVAVVESGRIVQEGSWRELTAAPATPTLARLLSS